MTRDATKPFNGEKQIETTLASYPLTLSLDVEKGFDASTAELRVQPDMRVKYLGV